MKRVIISAPFGNYLSSPHATSTLGTYTVKNRAGRFRWWLFWRILRTLRYRPAMGGWTNKLGLPNPGIEHLERYARLHQKECEDGSSLCDVEMSSHIVSLHGFNKDEWLELLRRVAPFHFGAFELNVSCPNVGHLSVPDDLFERAVAALRGQVIVKLPPVSYWETFELAYKSGVRTFHATNTLPVPAGGLSGKGLKRVALDVVKRIKDARPDIKVIGGGGITSHQDVIDYRLAGAEHFAVGSAFLNPVRALWPCREAFLESLSLAAEILTTSKEPVK